MAKEEGKGSYSMNNNVTDDYSTHIGEDDEDQITKSQAWGTWEELLLACAVKKHGFSDWDSVATEVRSRTSVSAVFVSANNCKLKYRDLKLRFQESAGMSDTAAAAAAEVEGADEERDGDIPWLEELRSLRVAELRREVERYDVSILSLQLKVKKLEEIEGSVVGEEKPDLEDERKGERLGNDGFEFKQRETAISTAEDSDRENRSMNESNSTASGEKNARVGGDEPSQTRDDSGDNNLDSDPKVEEGSVSRGSEASHSGELGESGTSERKWRRKRRKLSDGSEDNHAGEGGEIKTASKSQPLIDLLDLIWSHPRGSLFERRLRSQETQDYKSMVKQHLDIETIHKKLKQGSYDSSNVSFYRDLQLLFTNAIVFFPSSSSESMAAQELRTVVSEEMRKESGPKSGTETSEPSLSRQKSSAPPLVVCKKRKLVNGKASCSPSSSSFSQKEETKEETLSEEIVTGLRSSRRANKLAATATVITNNSKAGRGKNKKQTNSSNENDRKQTEKKRGSSSDKKKKSMTEFLERLKKNSPQKDQNKSGGSGKKGSNKKPSEVKRQSVSKKKVEVENSSPVKRGRGKKKTEETEATPTPKRGKESKQPKKRTRR